MKDHVISFMGKDGFYRIRPNSLDGSIRILSRSADTLRQELRRVQSIAVSFEQLIDTRQADEIEGILAFLAESEAVLMYYPGSLDEAQLTSLGDRDASGTFEGFDDQRAVFSRKYVVPRDEAIETIRNWIESGRIDNGPMRWTEELFDAGA